MSPGGASLQLEVVGGNAVGTAIGVDERLVFGRQSEGAGRLANDPELSRHHAEIARRPTGEYQLEDLSSTNGTYVNRERVQDPVVLALGDEIELGTTKLVVRALPAVAAPRPETVDVRAATVAVDVPAAARAPVQAQPPAEAPPIPASAPTPAPTPAAPPRLELRLRVDLARSEAEIALGEGQSVRLRLRDGRWQIVAGDSQ